MMFYSPANDRMDLREAHSSYHPTSDDWAEASAWHAMMDEAEALADINGELAIAGMEDETFHLT